LLVLIARRATTPRWRELIARALLTIQNENHL